MKNGPEYFIEANTVDVGDLYTLIFIREDKAKNSRYLRKLTDKLNEDLKCEGATLSSVRNQRCLHNEERYKLYVLRQMWG